MSTAVTQRRLIGHLSDTLAMEENVERQLRGMVAAVDDDPMRERFEEHLRETATQIERLASCLEHHGASRPKTAATRDEEGTGFSDAFAVTGGEPIARSAREAYATEHLEIAAYEMLERVATMAGDEIAAGVARTNRAEEEKMARDIAAGWDDITRRSLENAADDIVPPG